MKNLYSAGVDLGGTWLRVCLADAHGRPLKRWTAPAPPPERLGTALQKLWEDWGIKPPARLTVGSKGVWAPAKRQALARSLAGLARRIRVTSDVELAFDGAFASAKRQAGILVLAGTGSIALGRNRRGETARAGGLGPAAGDEGSGYWIGKEFLHRTKRRPKGPADSPAAVTKTAALARTVMARARQGDRLCADILRQAHERLAGLVLNLARRLRFKGEVPVSWAGGLFHDREFRKGFWEVLAARGEGTALEPVFPAQKDAALAAARLSST